MHWIILPSGQALNLAHVVTIEDKTSPYGDHPQTLGVHVAVYDAEAGGLCLIVLVGEDRVMLRQYLAHLSQAGRWPQNEEQS